MMKQKRRWIPVVVGVALGALWSSGGLAQSSPLQLSELRFAGAGSQRTLTLQFSQTPIAVQSFVLTSPMRLVIDVSGPVPNVSPGTIPVEDTLLARVRTGIHDHRLRFVLDLQTTEVPKFSVAQQQGIVTALLTAPGEQLSEPFSRVLFTLPGRAVPAPSTSVTVLPKTEDTLKTKDKSKTEEKQAPTLEQVKSGESQPAGEKKVAPVEQASTQEKPSSLPQPSLVGKPSAEEKKSGPVEKLAAPPVPAEPMNIAKKPEPEEQKTTAAEKAQILAQDGQAASLPQEPKESFERGQVLYAKGEVDAAIAQWQEHSAWLRRP